MSKLTEIIAANQARATERLSGLQAKMAAHLTVGDFLDSYDMERLLEAQAANIWWSRANQILVRGEDRVAEWVQDTMEDLIDGNVGGSTSLIANAKEAIERQAAQDVVKALRKALRAS